MKHTFACDLDVASVICRCYDVDLHVSASVHVSPDQGLVKMSQVGLGAMEFDEFHGMAMYGDAWRMFQYVSMARPVQNMWSASQEFVRKEVPKFEHFNFIQLFSTTSFVSGFKERFKSCFSSPRKGSTMLNSTRRARWTKSLEAKLWKYVGLRVAYFSKDIAI